MSKHRGFDPPDGGALEHSLRGAEISLTKKDAGLPCARCDVKQAEIERLREELLGARADYASKSREWEKANATLRARLKKAEEELRDVALSGVEFEDERISYVTVQIDRETWLSLDRLRGES